MQRIFNVFILISLLSLASCTGPKKIIYFNSSVAPDTSIETQRTRERPDILIMADDILAINVSSISSLSNTNPVGIFNEGGTQYNTFAGSIGGGVSGYLVDEAGLIDFPVLGKVRIGGMKIREAKSMLALKLKEYIKDPVVEVRIINYKITILGEIGRVGPISAPNHKMNIIEAIAAAGDIPLTGRKDNVLIIRENNGVREYGHLNLNSKTVFNSPYFYLQQNDIVYVEPSRIRRQETNEFLRFYLPTFIGLISTAAYLYTITTLAK